MSGTVNVHAAWRMALAQRAARVYARNGKLAAFAVAGSVGAGRADQFSDLELDCYWSSPPDEQDRTGPVGVLGGEVAALAVRNLLTRTGDAGVRAVLALNRVYLPHRTVKWQRHLLAGLRVAPERLADVVMIACTHTDADIASFREALAERRRAIDPPQHDY